MANGDIAQVAIRYRLYGQTMVNVQHFRENGSSTNLNELLAIFTTGGVASPIARLAGVINDNCRIQDLRAIYVRGGAPIEEVDTIDIPGVLAGTGRLPSTVSALISVRSSQIGRSNRGRIYLPPPTANQMDGTTGLWTLTYRTLLDSFITSWQLSFTLPSEWSHVVWSPTRAAAEGAAYIPPFAAHMLVDPVPRGQRRRAIELFV